MLNKKTAYSIIDQVVEEARGYDTRVIVQGGMEALTRIANSEIHQNVEVSNLTVTIVITQGKKRSQISTDLHTPEGLREGVQEAINNLAFLSEGEDQPPLVESPAEIESIDIDPDLKAQFSRENRAVMLRDAMATLEENYKAFGALTYNTHLVAVGNSRGIKRLAMGNSVSFTILVSSHAGGSGYADDRSSRDAKLDLPKTFARAYQKAKLNQNPEELEPGVYTVVLEPLAVGDILTYLSYYGFSAKSCQNQVSFLTGRLNEKVFDDSITIVDDYQNPNTLNLPFDFEGAPRQQVAIIQQGVVKGLTYDMASAKKDGVETTGHSVNLPHLGGLPLNLVMDGGSQSLEDIIASTQDGLLVTRFHYMNATNPRTAQLTALTRDGLFRIKGGKVTGAVRNLRFTESMLQALNQVEAISRERQRTEFFFGNYFVPALKIKDFHFTGKSG
jgi:PmbA protein